MRYGFQALWKQRQQRDDDAAVLPGDLADLARLRADAQGPVDAPLHLADRVASMAHAFGLNDRIIRDHPCAYAKILTACATCPGGDRCDYTFAMDMPMPAQDRCGCVNRPVYEGLAVTR